MPCVFPILSMKVLAMLALDRDDARAPPGCARLRCRRAVDGATQRVRDAFASHGGAYLKGDWSGRDPTITAYLRRFGRGGVPL